MLASMLRNFNIFHFQANLLDWYDENKRNLPWREDSDPYKVWVSEVMLQQTQVDTVIPYFYRFMEQFPTVYDLAEAEEEEVLKAWEGLGYYSRARNLQTAVREVVQEYNGEVPDNPKQLGKLKGIGPYTRGAILSIAFDQAEPAVDGNVMRVLSRVFTIGEDITQSGTRKKFEKLARELIPETNPAAFNQAIMELGALICTPKKPMCLFCPVNEYCQAYQEGTQEQLPVKAKSAKQKHKSYMTLLIKNNQGDVLIEKRPDKGLLANLWQFPMVPGDKKSFEQAEQWLYQAYGLNVVIQEKRGQLKHVFSHIVWNLDIYQAKIKQQPDNLDERLLFVDLETINNYPFPVPHQKMMKYL